MEDKLKCKYVELGVLYFRRLLYGYNCDLNSLWNDISELERAMELLNMKEECNLRGNIVDELNKLIHNLDKKYSDLCPNC